jgi:hypothetical protein
VPNPDHLTFWNNTIIQQTEFSHQKEIGSYREKRKIVTLMMGITALIAALAGTTYGVVSNYETTKNLTKMVEETSDKISISFKDMQRSLSSLAETVMDLGPGPRISSS